MNNNMLARWRQRRANRQKRPLAALMQAALLEPRQVEITRQPIQIERWPASLKGFRIVQLSDIHHSQFLSEREISEAVGMANLLDPDLVALTGDYVSHSAGYIPGCARALGGLRARLGVFAVLGNHDHWTDAELMASELNAAGIRVLRNETVTIEQSGARFHLAGVDDLLVHRDDLQQALSSTTRNEPRILLSHNPAIIREAARAGIDLVLSGHTHGGQINWRLLAGRRDSAFRRRLNRPSRRLMRGHAQLGGTQIYVNRGLGTVVLPLRYGCPPEITLLEID
jgi:predicted MPP superfamily phosphohydrolase